MREMMGKALGMMMDLAPIMARASKNDWGSEPCGRDTRKKAKEKRRWQKIRRKQGRQGKR